MWRLIESRVIAALENESVHVPLRFVSPITYDFAIKCRLLRLQGEGIIVLEAPVAILSFSTIVAQSLATF